MISLEFSRYTVYSVHQEGRQENRLTKERRKEVDKAGQRNGWRGKEGRYREGVDRGRHGRSGGVSGGGSARRGEWRKGEEVERWRGGREGVEGGCEGEEEGVEE